MAGSAAQLFIQIGAKVDQAVQGIQRVHKDMDQLGKSANQVSSNVEHFERDVIGLGLAALGTAGYLAKAAADQEMSFARLEQAAQNAGMAVTDDLSGAMKDWIQAQSQAAGFTQSEIIDALGTATYKTHDLARAQEIVALAYDVARAKSESLASAVSTLSEQTAGQINLLKTQGVFTDRVTSLDIQAAQAGAIAARAHLSLSEAYNAIQAGGQGVQTMLNRTNNDLDTSEKGAQATGQAYAFAAASTLSYAQALSAVVTGGQGIFNLMRRLGVETNQVAYSTNLAANKIKVVGTSDRMLASAGGAVAKLGAEWDTLTKSIGSVFLPVFTKVVVFGNRMMQGLQKFFHLFLMDATGTKMKNLRDIWKTLFGTEMPKFLGDLIGDFTKLMDKFKEVVDDLNSGDDSKIRGAFKKLAADVPPIIKQMLSDIGKQFDSMGALGLVLKVGSITLAADTAIKAFGVDDLIRLLSNVSVIGMGISKVPAPVAVVLAATAVITIAAVKLGELASGAGLRVDDFYKLVQTAMAGVAAASVAIAAGASAPVTITLAVGVVLAVTAVQFGPWPGSWGGLGQSKLRCRKRKRKRKWLVRQWIRGWTEAQGSLRTGPPSHARRRLRCLYPQPREHA
ncbi:MAG: hypothetical protein E6J20_17240 [Chloroflexi bacterium]|nr:MAG: hypothetical protein E6J20_17240 [Chloroflexota bacterium]